MGWFDFIGRNKREAAWLAEPRRLPEGAEAIPDGDARFLVSQEFCLEKSKNVRFYYAARPDDDRENGWVISKIQYDLKFNDPIESWDVEWATDPLQVVRTLRQFERRHHNDEKSLFIEGHHSTYRGFANAYGIHFDDKGNIIEVSKDTRLDKGVFMNREALDALFHNAAAKKPLDSWEEVYAQIVDKWPASWSIAEEIVIPAKVLDPAPAEAPAAADATAAPAAVEGADVPAATQKPETPPAPPAAPPAPEVKVVVRPLLISDVTADAKYASYAHNVKNFLGTLKAFPQTLLSAETQSWERPNAVRRLLSNLVITPGFVGDAEKLAQRLTDATMLVALLRAGAHVYDETLGKGDYTSDNIKLIQQIGESCSSFATMRLGVPEDDARKIADVISKGQDPYGPDLPLEKIFKVYPPPAYVKPASQPRASDGRYSKYNW